MTRSSRPLSAFELGAIFFMEFIFDCKLIFQCAMYLRSKVSIKNIAHNSKALLKKGVPRKVIDTPCKTQKYLVI